MSSWIYIDDEMPPDDGTRFCVWDHHEGFKPYIYQLGADYKSDVFTWSELFFYWMPVPGDPYHEQPKVDTNERS